MNPIWDRAQYPFESKFFDNAGVRQHYLDEGSGEPVVMVHGNPTWSFYYRKLAEALRREYRVVVPDHVGCGFSEVPGVRDYPYTLERRVDDLERLLDHLGLRSGVTLVLHDWGGMIGMAAAVRRPERIARLVILNTAAFHPPGGKRIPWELKLSRTPLGPALVRGLNLFCLGAASWCCAKKPLGPVERAGYLAPYDSWANRAAVLRFVQDIPLSPNDPGYDIVTGVERGLDRFRDLPVRIFWGEKDFVFDNDYRDEWARRFPGADLFTFPDCGHYILEDAAEAIIPLTREFLKSAPVRSDPGPVVNIASHLPRMAVEQPDALAVALPKGTGPDGSAKYERWSFRKLDEESNRIARGLDAYGIRRGMRTVLMVPPGPEFFALTFGLFKLGAVPVLVDPGMGTRNLKACLDEAAPDAFIGVPKAHLARIALGWAGRTLRFLVTVGGPRLWGGASLAALASRDASPYLAETRAGETAAILFTSGSTGVPKGAVYTHGVFAAQVESLREMYGIAPGDIDLPTFPLFALFGPALGMSAVIPDMDASRPAAADPRKLAAAIGEFGVTQMFGSPAVIDALGRFLEAEGAKLPSLKRVISAGAPVPPRVLERMASALPPGAEIHTPYGATEALPVATIGSAELLRETRAKTDAGGGVCVGRPVPGVEVRVIRINDEAIPEWSGGLESPRGEIGEIVVTGPVVTREYFNRPEATALAKISFPGGGFFHRMGDLGYFDEEGRLWFCGRKSHRVAAEGGTLYTVPCEAVFNTHPAVRRSALVGVGSNGATRPVLCVELEKSARESWRGRKGRDALSAELLKIGAAHDHTKGIRTVLFHPEFPVDVRHNAKIFREKLAVWAGKVLEGEGA